MSDSKRNIAYWAGFDSSSSIFFIIHSRQTAYTKMVIYRQACKYHKEICKNQIYNCTNVTSHPTVPMYRLYGSSVVVNQKHNTPQK